MSRGTADLSIAKLDTISFTTFLRVALPRNGHGHGHERTPTATLPRAYELGIGSSALV